MAINFSNSVGGRNSHLRRLNCEVGRSPFASPLGNRAFIPSINFPHVRHQTLWVVVTHFSRFARNGLGLERGFLCLRGSLAISL
jgi:hypothetical protein